MIHSKTSKKVSKRIKDREKETKAMKLTLASKKKALKEIESRKYKKKDVGTKEASDFLKKYAKSKK